VEEEEVSQPGPIRLPADIAAVKGELAIPASVQARFDAKFIELTRRGEARRAFLEQGEALHSAAAGSGARRRADRRAKAKAARAARKANRRRA
jgi:hypothetical protein